MVRQSLKFDMDDDSSDLDSSVLSDDSGIHLEDRYNSDDECDGLSPCKRTSPWHGDEEVSPKRRFVSSVDETSCDIKLDIPEHCLPTVTSKHADLKVISSETMSRLLHKQIPSVTEEVVIVDCRYPYEYQGGHIPGAINIWHRDSMSDFFEESLKVGKNQTNGKIIIFHCEFSLERGPRMARFLRNLDREFNADKYPYLCCPQIYLLEGGYKAFFQHNSSLCEPRTYMPMDEPSHRADLKHFRSKSKSTKNDKSSKCRRFSYRKLKF